MPEKAIPIEVGKSHRKKKKTHWINVFFSFLELAELVGGFVCIIALPWTDKIKSKIFEHDTAIVCYALAIQQIFVMIFMNDKLLTNLRCWLFMKGNHPTLGWDFINKIICFDFREPFVILAKPWTLFMQGGCCAITRAAFNFGLFAILGVLMVKRGILTKDEEWYGYIYFLFGLKDFILIAQRIPAIPLYMYSEYCDEKGEVLSSKRMDESIISDGYMRNLMTRRFLAANGVDLEKVAKQNII